MSKKARLLAPAPYDRRRSFLSNCLTFWRWRGVSWRTIRPTAKRRFGYVFVTRQNGKLRVFHG